MKNSIVVLITFACFFSFSVGCQAQHNKVVLGVNTGLKMVSLAHSQYEDSRWSTPVELTVEVPIGKFSIGTGLGLKQYSKGVNFRNGEFDLVEQETTEGRRLFYAMHVESDRLRYLSVPLKVLYRMPCNCLFIEAGADFDIVRLRDRKPSGYEYLREYQAEQKTVNNFNVTYSVGVGFKTQLSESFRLVFKPEFEFLPDPVSNWAYSEGGPLSIRLNMNIGAQLALDSW